MSARHIAFVVALAFACGDDDGSLRDAGSDGGGRDATFVDGGPISDAAGNDAASDSGAADAGAGMDASVSCSELCDPVTNTGCVDACVLRGEVPMCVEAPGTAEEGDRCERPDECAPGLACFLKRDLGVCGRVCCIGDESTCDPGERCGGPGVLVDGTSTRFNECLRPRSCDVLGDECEPMEGCYIVDAEGRTDCRAAGEREVGEDCRGPNDCAVGLSCTGLFSMTCVRVCELGATGSCPAGEGVCIGYAQSPEGTGLCTPE